MSSVSSSRSGATLNVIKGVRWKLCNRRRDRVEGCAIRSAFRALFSVFGSICNRTPLQHSDGVSAGWLLLDHLQLEGSQDLVLELDGYVVPPVSVA